MPLIKISIKGVLIKNTQINIHKCNTSPKQKSPGFKSTQTLQLCFPGKKLPMGPTSLTPKLLEIFYWQTPQNSFMTQETHLKPQDFISQTINTKFLFLQEQPGFDGVSEGKSTRHRFTTTAALLYSTTQRKSIPMITQTLQP